jgi:hypothetical protein
VLILKKYYLNIFLNKKYQIKTSPTSKTEKKKRKKRGTLKVGQSRMERNRRVKVN